MVLPLFKKGATMGEAEDIVAARQAGGFDAIRRRYEACLPEIQHLAPLAAANLKQHNYPSMFMTEVNFQGKKRVAWELYHNGWGGMLKIDLLADGTIVKNDGSHYSNRVLFAPSPSHLITSDNDAEAMEEVVSRLKYFATSDFEPPKIRGISPF